MCVHYVSENFKNVAKKLENDPGAARACPGRCPGASSYFPHLSKFENLEVGAPSNVFENVLKLF